MTFKISSERLWIGARVFVAVVIGYLFSMALCLCIETWSALPGNEARTLTSLLFYLVYTVFIMWVFSVTSHKKSVLSGVVATALLWLGWWIISRGAA